MGTRRSEERKRTERIPIEGKIEREPGESKTRTTIDSVLKNYWQDTLLSLLTGIYIRRISPKVAEASLIRGEKKAKEKSDDATVDSYIEKYREEKSITNKYRLQYKMVKEVLSNFSGTFKEKRAKKKSIINKFRKGIKE